MIQRYYWPPIPLNGDTSKSKCYVKEADARADKLAALRKLRKKIEKRVTKSENVAIDTEYITKKYVEGHRHEAEVILAIIDEEIKEVES